jgi:Dolichyl-phosphate-mannose-protein mannosyltransferase
MRIGINGPGRMRVFSPWAGDISNNHGQDDRATRMFALAVVGIILCSAFLRLYRIDAPLIDGFWDKQIAMANMSRDMAGPPFHLLNASYGFCLSPDGQRMPNTEEIPLYHGLVAFGYRMFGDQDWFGRVISTAGSLLAIAAFMGLMRREYDYGFAIVAGVIFAVCPMLLYYGRAVLPDTCMLGFMLAAAYGFRRALDNNSLGWLVACGFAGLTAVAFKYYGLMVLLPMAEMGWRGQRLKGLLKLCLPAAMMMLPLAAWMLLVFFRTSNPAQYNVYFIFQQPSILLESKFWARLADRFLWKSCGPVTAILMGVGLYAALSGRRMARAVVSWTVMGVAFYFLLGPKAFGHEYYELMMLPGAAGWATLGWCFLFRRSAGEKRIQSLQIPLGACLLILAAIIHSPWICDGRFKQDMGFMIAAQSAERQCSAAGRIVAGPFTPQPIVHYARREGWTWQEYPGDMQNWLDGCKKHGAECVVLYFDRKIQPEERRRYDDLIKTLPILEHLSGPWGLGRTPCEIYVLGLLEPGSKAEQMAEKSQSGGDKK